MPVFTDQMGHSIILEKIPSRIISLVPSQTELLADLGLSDAVVGITKFCVHPQEWHVQKTRVGGTKQVMMDRVHALNPDLIIANKEENVKDQVKELQKHYPVWTSNVNNLTDAYVMIRQLGAITGTLREATKMVQLIQENFSKLTLPLYRPQAAYLIWQKPYMTTGGDTFINSMLEAAGFDNAFLHLTRYPEVHIDQFARSGIDVLLLSSEPFPFREKHRDQLQTLLPSVKVILVDGEMFSWYGSRLRMAPGYFRFLRERV